MADDELIGTIELAIPIVYHRERPGEPGLVGLAITGAANALKAGVGAKKRAGATGRVYVGDRPKSLEELMHDLMGFTGQDPHMALLTIATHMELEQTRDPLAGARSAVKAAHERSEAEASTA